ncbi:hypothetical protein AAHC03_01521 [Spirometra sp. Aus1]
MSEHFLGYTTVASFLQLSGYEKMNDLISFVAKCREFGDISLRQQEKCLLNRLNKASGLQKLRYPVSGSVSSPDAKISILLQAQLNDHVILDSTLQADVHKVMICFVRTMIGLRSIIFLEEGQNQRDTRRSDEISLSDEFEERMKKNGFSCLIDIVELSKAALYKLWPDHPLASIRQLPGIGKDLADRLFSAGITSIIAIEKSGPRKIEEVLSRGQPIGDNIYEAALKIPKYELAVEQVLENTSDVLSFNFIVRLLRSCSLDQAAFIVGDDKNRILLKRKITTSEIEATGEWSQVVSIQRQLESTHLFVSLLSLNFLGIDLHLNFPLPWPDILSASNEDPLSGYKSLATACEAKCRQETPLKNYSLNEGLPTELTNSLSGARISQEEATELMNTGQTKCPAPKRRRRNQARPPQTPSNSQNGSNASFDKIKTPLIQTKIQNFFRKVKSFSEENPLYASTDDKLPVKSTIDLITPQAALYDPPHSCDAKIDSVMSVEHSRQPPKRFKWDPRRVKHSTPSAKPRGTLLGGPTSENLEKAVLNRTLGALLSSTPRLSSDRVERQQPLQTPLNACHSMDDLTRLGHSISDLNRSPGLVLDLSPILPVDQSCNTEEHDEFPTIEKSQFCRQVSERTACINLADMHSERQSTRSFAEPLPVKNCKESDLNTLPSSDRPMRNHNCSDLETVEADIYHSPTLVKSQDSRCPPGNADAHFSADMRPNEDRRHSPIVNCQKSADNLVSSNSPLRPPTVDLDTFPIVGSSHPPINTPTDQGTFSKKVSFGSLCHLRVANQNKKTPKTIATDVGCGNEPTAFLHSTAPCPASALEIKEQKPETGPNEATRKSAAVSKSTDSDCLRKNQLTSRDFDLICSGWEELDTFICCYNILKEFSSDGSPFVTISAPKTPPPTPADDNCVHGPSYPSVDAASTHVPFLSTGKFERKEESQGMEMVHEVEE